MVSTGCSGKFWTKSLVGVVMVSIVAVSVAQSVDTLTLVGSDTVSGDRYGTSVSVASTIAVVGARDESSGGGEAAYLYGVDTGGEGSWGQIKILSGSDAEPGSGFGAVVSANDDVVFVSAPTKNSTVGIESGAVYMFGINHLGTNNWGQRIKFVSPAEEASGLFGSALDSTSAMLIVGAPLENAEGLGTNVGRAYIYTVNEGGSQVWGLSATLDAGDDADAQDQFGFAVSGNNQIAAVCSISDDDAATNAGAVYIYGVNQGGALSWGLITKTTPLDGASRVGFCDGVDNTDTLVVVSNLGLQSVSGYDGVVYVFAQNSGGSNAWGQVARLSAPESAGDSLFADSAVAVNDVFLVVGALAAEVDGVANVGAAYVYSVADYSLRQTVGQPVASGGSGFGASVAATESKVLVGAPFGAGGQAFLYSPCPSSLYQFDSDCSTPGGDGGNNPAPGLTPAPGLIMTLLAFGLVGVAASLI